MLLDQYKKYLEDQELSQSTIDKYLKDIEQFEEFKNDKRYKQKITVDYRKDPEFSKDLIIDYKKDLARRYKTSTTNNKIIIINKYLKWLDLEDLTVKQVKEQNKGSLDNVLTQTDFNRIYRQAEQKGTERDKVMLNALLYTGLRVSELEFLTVEALKAGSITVNNKGKIRQVPITNQLAKQLKAYTRANRIETGSIILNNQGKPLSRNYVFKRLKWLGGQARVRKDKVYPHSIRHLFAKNWLAKNKNNVLQLADILGHSSLETTRIYTKLNTDELRATME